VFGKLWLWPLGISDPLKLRRRTETPADSNNAADINNAPVINNVPQNKPKSIPYFSAELAEKILRDYEAELIAKDNLPQDEPIPVG